ncbi:sensor histidine kinase, partial [Pseudomonas sp. FSL R10-0071]|nr:sensor histidine kinase [Pseudomonas sp. FSL R10-0071]
CALNRKLERINGAAKSSTLELMDHTGLAVAASNWNTANSYVGHNYAFRPYFKQTLVEGTGSFYAVGVTSGIPGYFLSSAIHDAKGIVFIANQPGWRYRHLRPLSDQDRSEITVTRQYHKQPLTPLNTRTLRSFDDNSFLTRTDGPDGSQDYLWESLPLSAEGWTLHLLRRPDISAEDRRNAALAGVG